MVLIYGDQQRWDSMSADEMAQIDAGHRAFGARAGSAVLASGELEPLNLATTLRAGSSGKPVVTDGPFLETKEVLGGFYLLEAANLDEVIFLASGLGEVSHDHSGVEIVPLVDHG
jgi:hypothetical protein